MIVSSDGVERARQRLRDPRTRVVGWGTGSVFDYFYASRPSGDASNAPTLWRRRNCRHASRAPLAA